MGAHVHVDAIDAVKFGALLLIWLAIFRLIAARYSDSTIGKALGSLVA